MRLNRERLEFLNAEWGFAEATWTRAQEAFRKGICTSNHCDLMESRNFAAQQAWLDYLGDCIDAGIVTEAEYGEA